MSATTAATNTATNTATTTATTRCVATAVLLLCAAAPVAAQWSTGLVKDIGPAAGSAVDPYTGPVDPLPWNCNFFMENIPNGTPRVRPVLQKPGANASAASAQVVPGVPLQPGMRQVAYSYNFTRLGLRIPPIYLGSFRVTSVRTTVYKGPTSAYPVASDRTVTGTDSATGVGSVTQAWSNGPLAGFSNTWLVRNISTGWWLNGWGYPEERAAIGMQCTMAVSGAVTGAPPPMVLQ